MAAFSLALGCTDADLTGVSPAQAMRQLASATDDDTCVAKALEWGDKDHDGVLTELEYTNLALIAFDYAMQAFRNQVAIARSHPKAYPPDALAALERDIQTKLERGAKRREGYVVAGKARFLRFDTNKDGRLDRAELAAACNVLAHEPREVDTDD